MSSQARVAWLAGFLVLGGLSTQVEGKMDHSRLPALRQKFKDGPSVTRACLSCHSQSGHDILTTSHWLWRGEETVVPGRDGTPHRIGKANLINNFCIGIQSNEVSCTRCHIGFGWKDKSFDFKNPDNIDCLVCHDTTGEYVRHAPESPPQEPIDWNRFAQNVGRTSRQTCGSCHFSGGGGEGVKHGDLDPSLMDGSRDLDLHMAPEGLNFSCSSCHRGEERPHQITGSLASVSAHTGNVLSCAKCHGESPHGHKFIFRTQIEKETGRKFRQGRPWRMTHKMRRLNWHAEKLACQTCHVPHFAKQVPTKTWWDWSKAGRRSPDGEPEQEVDDEGNVTYLGIKGEFRWGQNLAPDYRWYNGGHERYLLGDKFDPKKVLVLNTPLGGPGDPGSKIWPFKIMRGRQIYDVEHQYLIQPKLAGPKGSGAYWKDYDWNKASRAGMAAAGLPFSGKYDFADTEMYWPLRHMTVEGGQALSCADCHSRDGRLKNVPGIYVPGQHRSSWLDVAGWSAVAASLAAVLFHGFLRWLGRRKKETP